MQNLLNRAVSTSVASSPRLDQSSAFGQASGGVTDAKVLSDRVILEMQTLHVDC
jgi:hypothetical protein